MKILDVIGTINDNGGFGLIEEVRCDDGNSYARKTYSPPQNLISDPTLNEKLKTRFIREVKTQKLLPKELFIEIIYDELDCEKPWFLMPIADDVYTNEINRCKNTGKKPDGLSDILNSLEYIHEKGLVHRDLKPQNILHHEGVWKLADFGLISQDKDILSKSITTSHNAFGTAMYCAPEQTTDFKRVNHQADIYSFGAILHDIFTDGKRVPYSELSGTGNIGFIIEKCTKHKREQRFKSIKSLRNKLLYIISKENVKALTNDSATWLNLIKKSDDWDSDKLENFVFYLNRNEDFWDIIFYEISSDLLNLFYKLNKDYFNEFALLYLKWVKSRGFQFGYCDVIIGYVYEIYNKSIDLEVKTNCIISSAELAKSHNRWYVMRYVVKMSNKEIEDSLAFRVVLEIEIDRENKYNLKRCVEGINLNTESYHNLIEEALN